jgi:predicted nucleic acid-binding protein
LVDIRLLVDANVILDVLFDRQPFSEAAAQVLEYCRQHRDNAFVAAHHITTIFYLYARDLSPEKARVALVDLNLVLKVAAVDQTAIDAALTLPYRDFEDAVTMMAAVGVGAECVVTRNPRHFEYGPLPVLSPAEFLQRL